MKKAKREVVCRAFDQKWCPKCGRVTHMLPIPTGLPGIQAQRCTVCMTGFQVNWLEDSEDLIDCPTAYTFPDEQ